MVKHNLTRRSVLAGGAAAAVFATPFVRGAHAAGRLSVGFWDHWVPGANDVMRKIVQEWADKEKVDVSADFITSTGDKLRITIAAEAQAGSGHDVLAMSTWLPASYADKLEPVDDVVKSLIQQGGDVGKTVEYLGQADGRWIAVPTTVGTQTKPPCGRIDLFKEHLGLDITQMYPAGGQPSKELTDRWTWDFFLEAAEKMNKAGHPFGMPMGPTSDAVDWVGAVFAAYGAQFVDEKGNITIKSDATRQVLDWFKKLVPNLPPDVFAWDDASNNKALVSGKSALIMNPPSAWAVAKRDAPQVAQNLWTFGPPKGPKGRMMPFLPYYWTIWKFAVEQAGGESAADLSTAGEAGRAAGRGEPGLRHPALSQAQQLQRLVESRAARGHDLQLSAALRGRDYLDRDGAGAAEHRGTDVHAGDQHEDDRAVHAAGQVDRSGDGLGRR